MTNRRDLFPPIEPYRTGTLRLDARHVMYWEQSGNPRGTPALFLHGGPGAGATAVHRRFFDPEHWRIVIFDQRGAGRSTPLGETAEKLPRSPGVRYRAFAHGTRHREVAGVRGILGLDTGAALCRDLSGPLHRACLARDLSLPAARDRVVSLWHPQGVPGGVACFLGVPYGRRAARIFLRRIIAGCSTPIRASNAGGTRMEHL